MDSFHNIKGSASSSKQMPNDKNIDADSMIRSIISQQDTFVMNNNHQLYSSLPKWMIPKSGFVHPLYEQIWQYVKSDKRDRTCDTNLVSQLLMTSGLPVDILGGLWSMANVGVEGSLSQQELYVILALITLVQNGYSVSNVSLLQHIHKPIIPQLNYALIEKKHNTSTVKFNVDHRSQQETIKSTTLSKQQNVYTKNLQQPNFNVIPSEDYDPLAVSFIEPKNQTSRIISPIAANPEPKSLDLVPVNDSFDTFDEEFSDFQYAQYSNTDTKNNHEFTDFQSAFDTLSFSENTNSVKNDIELLNISSIDATLNTFENKQNLLNCEDDIHDKYEVFRTLAAETVDEENSANENNYNDLLDVKHSENIEENVQNYDDEFGDFLYVEEVSNSKLEVEVDWKNVQVQCIEKCLEFLKSGVFTFSSITDEKVLMEVINHDKGFKYLTQLNLISQICKRILKNCYCKSLEIDLIEILSKLEIFSNSITHDSSDNSEILDSTKETILCHLCKCNCNTDNVEYMLNPYHSSCINFLLNFVQNSQISVK